MNILKRGLVTAAIVGSLVGGVAAMPGGVVAKAGLNQNGANCHGNQVSGLVAFESTGLGNSSRDHDVSVKVVQQNIRDTCAKLPE